MILTMPVVADAATILAGNYDPADYIHDITISDDTKTIRYDFSDIRYRFKFWESNKGTVTYYDDNFEVLIDDTYQYVVACFPFGADPSVACQGAVYVGDISPGSPLGFEFDLEVYFEWYEVYEEYSIALSIEPFYVLYDASGYLLGTYNLDITSKTYTLVNEQAGLNRLSDLVTISGTIPIDAVYVAPAYRLRVTDVAKVDVYFGVQGAHTALSVDINTVLENSNQMQAIQNKLDDLQSSIGDVGDKIDGTNDRLDQIITGGDAGDSLGAAGDQLEDASGAVSDKADSVVDDIGSVGDFESGVMNDINSAFGQIDVASGVGKFNTSLAFISNYVQLIFDGVQEWEVAIMLPLFLGLFFGICQHVGGVANMRARQAREARNEELHQARLEKIQKGGSN